MLLKFDTDMELSPNEDLPPWVNPVLVGGESASFPPLNEKTGNKLPATH
jgi:hypothetical protein